MKEYLVSLQLNFNLFWFGVQNFFVSNLIQLEKVYLPGDDKYWAIVSR